MKWLELTLVSAPAAALGALFTLFWVAETGTDTGSTGGRAETQSATGAPAPSPHFARLEDELAEQAGLLAQLNADNAELTVRIRELERLQYGDEGTFASGDSASSHLADTGGEEEPVQEEPADVPPQQLLERAGIEPTLAEAIQLRISALEMERLYLRDQATREGWRDSERFTTEMQELVRPEEALRSEFGDEVYDQYLYAMGQGNRVLVSSTLQDSPADVAGIRAGDTVLSYAGERVYSISDLQSATVAGEPGASVVVELLRDGVRWYATVPRGPLGVRLDTTRRAPGTG